ncbi:MAG: ligase-associated DNA damage response endonuclease PdeM [Flavobacteriales bacterium]
MPDRLKEVIVEWKGHHFRLLPQKAIYWLEKECLIVSDMHVGKSGFFRKNGIPVSGELQRNDLVKLLKLIESTQCKRLLINGDLVHEAYNAEWDDFNALMDMFPEVKKELIIGNHDKLLNGLHSDICLVENELVEDGFCFVHEPSAAIKDAYFYFFGHLHPAVSLKGKGRQRLRLPCFLQSDNQVFMPAFSDFTGLNSLPIKRGNTAYAIAGDEILIFNA